MCALFRLQREERSIYRNVVVLRQSHNSNYVVNTYLRYLDIFSLHLGKKADSVKKKHTVCFSDGVKSAVLELCVFCERMKDIGTPGECEYFSGKYEDCSCSEFIKVDDVAKRLSEALEARASDEG